MGLRRLVTSHWKIATVMAALIPMAALASLMVHYSVSAPCSEEWSETAAMKGFSRFPTISFLFSQHSEHRIVMTRLILWVTTAISGGDLRYSLAVTFAVAMLISIMTMILIRRTLPGDQPWQWWWLACHLLIFSPVQHQNWLWALNVHFLLPIACLMAGLVVIEVLPGGWRQTVLCMFLAMIAAFSHASGLIVTVLLPLAVLAHRPRESRARLAALGVFIVALWLGYFHGWSRPTFGAADPFWCIHHPRAVAQYILAFLGSCVSRGLGTSVSMAFGALVLAVWLTQLGYVAIHLGKEDLLRKAGPWLILGVYAIASMGMATSGRVALGVTQAQASRYTTTSLQLWVSAIALWPILSATLPACRPSRLATALGRLAVVGLLISFLIAQVRSIHEIRREWFERLRGQVGLELMNYPNSDAFLRTHDADHANLRQAAIEMNDLGRLYPPILPANRFDSITSQTSAQGIFQESIAQPNGSILVRGTACLPSGRPADCVVITRETDATHWTVIWMIRVAVNKSEIVKAAGPGASPGCWKGIIPARQIPSGNAALVAWAFDATNRTAYRLDKSHSWSQ